MALNRYVLTAKVTVPAGAYTADVATPGTSANFGTGSYAQGASEYGSAGGATWYPGQVIWADPSGALYTAIGSGSLRAFADGTDTNGHWGVSNLCFRSQPSRPRP
jgi:hypothetical protein